MKKLIYILLLVAGVIASIVLFIMNGAMFTLRQQETFKILFIIMLSSVAYCFIVGEISRNNSQMDKLWSLLPIAYIWVIAIMGGLTLRLIVMAILVTFWGIRLTINFGKKGAYKLKFWEGEEDYRWQVLRNKKPLNNKIMWGLFDLLFISFYQNFLVFLTVLPGIYAIDSPNTFNYIDVIASVLMFSFILIEMIADIEQWNFQSKKWGMINEGKKLEELPEPYNLGFNTTGLWNRSRHPNYFGEQGTWVSFYIFSIASGLFIFNYSMIGAFLLLLLFVGSSMFSESISNSKYPLYGDYCKKVSRYIPLKKYR